MKTGIVAKFGGTSLGNARAMRRSASIAVDRKASVVVVSATAGTTDHLVALSSLAAAGDQARCRRKLQTIAERHRTLAKQLKLPGSVASRQERLFATLGELVRRACIAGESSPKTAAAVQGFGEDLSANLFAGAINGARGSRSAVVVDARSLIKTNGSYVKAEVDFDKTGPLVRERLGDPSSVYVVQGFVGSDSKGSTTLLGRGGSDYSASILAWAAGASGLQIWTDVAGIKTTDPNICSSARSIPEITFQEAAELATFGAKILHPAALSPARRAGIPVVVRSSFEPRKAGTRIVAKNASAPPLVRAMAKRDDQCLLTISTAQMLYAPGFLYRIFRVFHDLRISVDSVTTSEISVAVTVNTDDITPALVESLQAFARVRVEGGLSLVSLIGNNINYTPGLGARVFQSLGDINVRMICQGASKHNFCFLVQSRRAQEAVRRLHKTFIDMDKA